MVLFKFWIQQKALLGEKLLWAPPWGFQALVHRWRSNGETNTTSSHARGAWGSCHSHTPEWLHFILLTSTDKETGDSLKLVPLGFTIGVAARTIPLQFINCSFPERTERSFWERFDFPSPQSSVISAKTDTDRFYFLHTLKQVTTVSE